MPTRAADPARATPSSTAIRRPGPPAGRGPAAAGRGAPSVRGNARHAMSRASPASPAPTAQTSAKPPPAPAAPSSGPIVKAAPRDMPSRPIARDRCSGGLTSAASACATPMLPPHSPASTRAASSSHTEPAPAIAASDSVEPASPSSSTRRRPNRSAQRPSSGAATACPAEKPASTRPRANPPPPSSTTRDGSTGSITVSPSRSTNTTALSTRHGAPGAATFRHATSCSRRSRDGQCRRRPRRRWPARRSRPC